MYCDQHMHVTAHPAKFVIRLITIVNLITKIVMLNRLILGTRESLMQRTNSNKILNEV